MFGPESSGKTTVALQVIAQAQKRGGVAAFIDVEHALDPIYAKALGVDIDGLLVSQPDTGEQALEITEALVRSGAIDVIVLDSVAAMTTSKRSGYSMSARRRDSLDVVFCCRTDGTFVRAGNFLLAVSGHRFFP